MTTQELINRLNELIEIKPEAKNFKVIVCNTSTYYIIDEVATLCQAHDPTENYNIEIVGHYEEDDNIDLEDTNMVCIN